MEWIEVTAKSLDEAVELALDRLGVVADELEFEVLDEPRSGLFGMGRVNARIRARVKPLSREKPVDKRRRRRGSEQRSGGSGGSGGSRGSGRSARGDGHEGRREPRRRAGRQRQHRRYRRRQPGASRGEQPAPAFTWSRWIRRESIE